MSLRRTATGAAVPLKVAVGPGFCERHSLRVIRKPLSVKGDGHHSFDTPNVESVPAPVGCRRCRHRIGWRNLGLSPCSRPASTGSMRCYSPDRCVRSSLETNTAAWVRRSMPSFASSRRHVVLDGLLGQEHPFPDLFVGSPSPSRSSNARSWSVSPDSGLECAASPRSFAINAAAALLSSSDLPAPTSLIARARSIPLMDARGNS